MDYKISYPCKFVNTVTDSHVAIVSNIISIKKTIYLRGSKSIPFSKGELEHGSFNLLAKIKYYRYTQSFVTR